MPTSSEVFTQSILDAENLLKHFNALNTQPPPQDIEILKRAGLIMAMTAWETYVEDRVLEATKKRLSGLTDSAIADFIQSKLDDEIKRLHNPTFEKTIQLFQDYVGVDLMENWSWNNCDSKMVRKRLNQYMELRGGIVHRSRLITPGPTQPHPVTKEKLKQVIQFLKNLVEATERALS